MNTLTAERPPVLELEGVDVPSPGLPQYVVVRCVQWRVMAGERWLVSGPARAGKSSVVGVAAGLIRPASGCHRMFGEDLATLRESERLAHRLKVGMVFGGGGRLFPTLNVVQNLALPLMYHAASPGREEADRVKRMLEVLGLETYAHWFPGDLPRWVAQRVALARALVLRPTVLMLDDPTLGLPEEEVAWWRTLLDGGAGMGTGLESRPSTWVVAATEPRPWQSWADRSARVEGGRWSVIDAGAGLRP